MDRSRWRDGRLGSVALLLITAALIVRPWEGNGAHGEGPPAAKAFVARVIDGDTIEARVDGELEDVRYIGVDTPETVKPDTSVQCFGPRASTFNHHLVERRRVRLVFGVERRDVYGRLLAYVYLGHRFVNAILVRRGLARSLTIAPNDRFAPLFRGLELRAARSGRGLWGICPP
jgi:micrococcal nuclease